MSDEQKLQYLTELIKSEGWAIVQERIDSLIDDVETRLFGDDDEGIVDTEPLKPNEIELLRRQRKHLLHLKSIPNQIIFEIGSSQPTIDDYDPYEE